MKKLFCLITAAVFWFNLMPAVHATGILGPVYTTDIGALIDRQPIPSYNFQDHTYIKAEDLRGYGFRVDWDSAWRTLSVRRDASRDIHFLDPAQINIKKADIPYLQKLYDVYETDIRTDLDGRVISACNIDGETLIKLSDLSVYGTVRFDEENRLAMLDLTEYDLDQAWDTAEKQTFDLGSGITYEGSALNGKPYGYGKKYDKSQGTSGSPNIDMTYTGFFRDTVMDGPYYQTGTQQFTQGSYQDVIHFFEFGTYHNGKNQGLRHSFSDWYGDPVITDAMYSGGVQNGICRISRLNPEYLYGMEVQSQHLYKNGQVWDLEEIPLPKFTAFGTNVYSPLSVIDESGNLFTAPYATDTGLVEAVFRRRNVQDGNYGDGWVLARDQKLYRLMDEDESHDICVAENVKSATQKNYLDQNGVLWEDAQDGAGYFQVASGVKAFSGWQTMMFLKQDGTVWTYRSKNEPGSSWNDGLDRSLPVQRAAGATAVSTDGTCYLYLTEDGTLWGFGDSYDGQLGRVDTFDSSSYNYDTSLGSSASAVKLGEGFVSVKAGPICLAQKADGSLWAWGKNDMGQIISGGDTAVLSPVKILEDVKDYACSYGAVYAVKTDGTLWYRGETWSTIPETLVHPKFPVFQKCTQAFRPFHWVIPQ